MTDKHYEHAKNSFHYDKTSYEVWNIPDLRESGYKDDFIDYAYEVRKIEYSEKTFLQIKEKVDDLAKKLTHANR